MIHQCLWLILVLSSQRATNVECFSCPFPLEITNRSNHHTSRIGKSLKQLNTRTNNKDDDNNMIELSTSLDSDSDANQIRFRGRVTYDGSGFRGWQVQSRGRTCQGVLEQALSLRFNRTVKIVGAGRTDAGVHARGQAFHFDLYPDEVITSKGGGNDDPLIDGYHESFCQQLQRSLNRLLEQDIRVYNIMRAPLRVSSQTIGFLNNDPSSKNDIEQEWHAIIDATKKLYTYRISLNPHAITCYPLQRYTRVHIDGDIDPEYLQRILRHYEGEHDFRAFAGAIEVNLRKDGLEHKNTVRTVYSVDLIDEGQDGHYRIEILLKGALYKMVRNMVGTALDVCKGKLSEEAMLQMLHHYKDDGSDEENVQFSRKDNKCKPAPPEGLTLEKVYYDDDGF
mmetsp:Transcript_818/g.1416  ORF Transcript_818/g.1416 Transcript_818/m.1416 type:complete len:394 (+) Transcript_818:70-1251(+)